MYVWLVDSHKFRDRSLFNLTRLGGVHGPTSYDGVLSHKAAA